jgi:4a-hydroxytetrahydrobiopterin dehydratase
LAESKLSQSKYVPCKGVVEPLKGRKVRDLAAQLSANWHVIDEHHLENEFKFKNFKQGLDFVNKVGQLAESEGHHPDIYLSWVKVQVCEVCGYTLEGDDPDRCPLCNATKDKFTGF